MNDEQEKPPISENQLAAGAVGATVALLLSWGTMDFFLIKGALACMLFVKTLAYHYYHKGSDLFWAGAYAYLLVSVTVFDYWVTNPEAFQKMLEFFHLG